MTIPKKSKAAVSLGKKGGKARAAKLTKQQLSEIGKKGGLASAAARLRENKA